AGAPGARRCGDCVVGTCGLARVPKGIWGTCAFGEPKRQIHCLKSDHSRRQILPGISPDIYQFDVRKCYIRQYKTELPIIKFVTVEIAPISGNFCFGARTLSCDDRE
ncbi:MAG: hypothetical protein V4793_16265, partial [Paraburkholderia tropica]